MVGALPTCAGKLVVFLALLIIIACRYTPGHHMVHQGTCQRTYVLAAKATSNGTLLYFTTGSVSSPRSFTIEVPGHRLPTLECGDDYVLCDLLLTERDSKLLIFLPSQGGFVKVTYESGPSPHYRFYSVDKNCHPVKSFSNENGKVFMECLNLASDTDKNLYVAALNLDSGSIDFSGRSRNIRSPSELSYAVYASNKIFVVGDQHLLYTEAMTTETLQAHLAFEMAGCTQVNQMDAVSDNLVYMYCNNHTMWSATTHAIQGNSLGSYIFPCVESGTTLHVRDGKLKFNKTGSSNNTVIDLPSEDIVFGLCHGSESNGTLAFWGQTGDGLLFSVDLSNDDHNITHLSQCQENATCLRPAIERGRTFGGYFDYDTNFFHIRNFTGQCGHVSIELPFPPDLLQVFTAQGPEEDDCSCPVSRITEPPSEATTNASDIIASSMPNLEAVIAGVVGGVVGLSLVLGVAFIVCCVCRRFWPSDHVSHKGLREANVPIEGGSDIEDTEDKTASKGGFVGDIEMEPPTSAATDMASPDVAVETPMRDAPETGSTHSTTQAEANQRTGSPELPKLDLHVADPPTVSAHTPPVPAHTPPASAPPAPAHTPPAPATTAMPETSQRTDNAELFVPVNTSPYPPDLRRSGMKKDKNWTVGESPAGQPQHCPNDNEDSNVQLLDINRHMVTTEPMPATCSNAC